MHKNAQSAKILVQTAHKTISGHKIEVHTIPTEIKLPWRVAKRHVPSHKLGVNFVRALGDLPSLKQDGSGIRSVTVTDGRRVLASWRRMEGLGGFTGTNTVADEIKALLKK